ncbi:MAG: hypothetical protein HYW13_01130, partial [Planctomycetes bacterium]|nr:hypothetical protein [Planctomycetota bacterium]
MCKETTSDFGILFFWNFKIIYKKSDPAAKKKNHDKTITRLVENTKIGFEEAMDDDLNISQALAMFFEFITEINKIMDSLSPKDAEIILGFLTHIDKVLGVMTFEVEEIP